ncbi:MAG: phage GP46 family protein [Desulfovibrionaceae bacterium]|nr:phage GP46 family protein [Desulfovibrionaceae bacterium]
MDIALAFSGFNSDLTLFQGDLAVDAELFSAVVVSLFTDRLAERSDELPAGETSRRGWWADATLPGDRRYGSRLWLLRREKQTAVVLARAKQYAEEALAWMLEDGLAESVEVSAAWAAQGVLALSVVIDADQSFEFSYDYLTATLTE